MNKVNITKRSNRTSINKIKHRHLIEKHNMRYLVDSSNSEYISRNFDCDALFEKLINSMLIKGDKKRTIDEHKDRF
jgi:hypothetical protein